MGEVRREIRKVETERVREKKKKGKEEKTEGNKHYEIQKSVKKKWDGAEDEWMEPAGRKT
jgi:hypothetical protein